MKIHVKIQNNIYDVRIGDILSRPIQATVDGEVFEVWPEEMIVPSSEQRGTSVSQITYPVQPADIGKLEDGSSINEFAVKAPIPGVIIEIMVSSGDAVEYGQELCVLEAMKMKNSIRSGKVGTIDKVLISVGDQVSQNQPLIEYRGKAHS